MCTSAAQHIHSTLPRSTRLYYDTMKTVCTSPLMGPEPCRVNSDGCSLQSASDTWENSPLEEPLLWQRGSKSRNPRKIHNILRLHQNKFFLWYARPKLSLCPVPLKSSSVSPFLQHLSPSAYSSSDACMGPDTFIGHCFMSFLKWALLTEKTSHHYDETNRLWVLYCATYYGSIFHSTQMPST